MTEILQQEVQNVCVSARLNVHIITSFSFGPVCGILYKNY